MIFKLSKASYCNTEEEKAKYEKLGFRFDHYEEGSSLFTDSGHSLTIEINSLEKLVKFTKEYGQIVLDVDEIIIYDGYLE